MLSLVCISTAGSHEKLIVPNNWSCTIILLIKLHEFVRELFDMQVGTIVSNFLLFIPCDEVASFYHTFHRVLGGLCALLQGNKLVKN